MGKVRTVIVSVLLAGAGTVLAAWHRSPTSATRVRPAACSAARWSVPRSLLVSELGWWRERHSR